MVQLFENFSEIISGVMLQPKRLQGRDNKTSDSTQNTGRQLFPPRQDDSYRMLLFAEESGTSAAASLEQ